MQEIFGEECFKFREEFFIYVEKTRASRNQDSPEVHIELREEDVIERSDEEEKDLSEGSDGFDDPKGKEEEELTE